MKKLLLISFLIMTAAVSISAQQRFVAALSGAQEVPANNSAGKGTCTIVLNAAETQITVNCTFSGLGTNATAGHIHGNAAVGTNAGILFGFTGVPASTSGTFGPLTFTLTPAQVADMRAHRHYVNIHTSGFPGGEIRGQIKQVHTVFDRDGDGRTDVVIYRQSTREWWIRSSLTGGSQVLTFGTPSGDNWLNNSPGDFDGDGIGDLFHVKLFGASANWSWSESSTFNIQNVWWGNFTSGAGQPGDTLAYADYDGDGKTDVAVYRRGTGQWFIRESTTGQMRVVWWGAAVANSTAGDFPSVGDYDGDGRADPTVVRVEGTARVWYILKSTTGMGERIEWGLAATDSLFFFAPFDIDGDGKQDISINRATAGQRVFHIRRSSDGTHQQIAWGASTGTTAMFGDYDGDGKTDLVARLLSGGVFTWQILRSSDGTAQYIQWGGTGDQ